MKLAKILSHLLRLSAFFPVIKTRERYIAPDMDFRVIEGLL